MTSTDPAEREHKLADALSSKSAQLLDVARRTDHNGNTRPADDDPDDTEPDAA